MIKLSFAMFKNEILSKKSIMGIAISFIYSLLWIFVVNPDKFGVVNFTAEYFKLLYVLIIYLSFQLVDFDVKNNILINLFTGVFSRLQIIMSKLISLIFLGIYFAFIGELNNLFVSIASPKSFGISKFLEINHLKFILSIMLVIFTMGSLCLLILSLNLKSKTISTITTIAFGIINFFSYSVVTGIEYLHHPITPITNIFMKTPMYNTAKLLMEFNFSNVVLYISWGILFFFLFTVIMNKKEIS